MAYPVRLEKIPSKRSDSASARAAGRPPVGFRFPAVFPDVVAHRRHPGSLAFVEAPDLPHQALGVDPAQGMGVAGGGHVGSCGDGLLPRPRDGVVDHRTAVHGASCAVPTQLERDRPECVQGAGDRRFQDGVTDIHRVRAGRPFSHAVEGQGQYARLLKPFQAPETRPGAAAQGSGLPDAGVPASWRQALPKKPIPAQCRESGSSG